MSAAQFTAATGLQVNSSSGLAHGATSGATDCQVLSKSELVDNPDAYRGSNDMWKNMGMGSTSIQTNKVDGPTNTNGMKDKAPPPGVKAADGEFPEATESMNIALSLNHDASQLSDFYDKWAASYDQDVSDGFMLPSMMITALHDAVELSNGEASSPTLSRDSSNSADSSECDKSSLSWVRNPDTRVMDAGCGTGAVGNLFAQAGYKNVDGVDLSNAMIEKAKETGAYRHLAGAYDLNKPVLKQYAAAYDVVTIAGVFTVGHVPPESLRNVAAMVRPGGVLVTSTRRAYYDRTNYQEVSDMMEQEGVLKLVHKVNDGPYTMDSTAHYWVYQVMK